jgi:hypothetical protein
MISVFKHLITREMKSFNRIIQLNVEERSKESVKYKNHE